MAKKAVVAAFSVEREIKDAEARLMQFEDQIQSGEYDASDDENTLAKRKIAIERVKSAERYRGDVAQVIARPEGRRVLWKILQIAGPNRLSPNISDPYVTAMNEGRRAVANDILLLLWDADQSVYARMQNEALSDLKSQLERKKKESDEAKEKLK